LAICKFCGDPVGSSHRLHADCEVNFQLAERQIAMEVAGAVSAAGDIEGLPSRIAGVAAGARMSEGQVREMVITGWARAIETFLKSSVLNEEEERRLIRLEYLFGLSQADLHRSDVWLSPQADAA